MPEHLPVPVDEIVLFEGIQYDGYAAVEQLRQFRIGIPMYV